MAQFNRDDPLPSWIMNSVLKALSLLAEQLVLVKTDSTHIQLPAGADDLAVVLAIRGLWRWIEAPITLAHPGGAAGAYPVFATAKANNITNVPLPNSDNTDYGFSLVIEAPGGTPPVVAGTVDVYRHVGDVVWDGSAITRIDQFAPQTPMHARRHSSTGPDPLAAADIGAVDMSSPYRLQSGDLVPSAATSRAGAVLCDGTAYSRTDPVYAALFGKIGTRYGAGDGSTTFNVPDYRNRAIVGASTTHLLGSVGGAETMTLAPTNLPAHYHGWGASTGGSSADHTHAFLGNTNGQSAGHTHGTADGTSFVCGNGIFVSDVYNNPQPGHSQGFYSSADRGSGQFTTGPVSNDHTHIFGGNTVGRSADHTHAVSGNTDNGFGAGAVPLAGTAFSLRDPYGTANVFIVL